MFSNNYNYILLNDALASWSIRLLFISLMQSLNVPQFLNIIVIVPLISIYASL